MADETRSAVLEPSTAAEFVRKAEAPGVQSAASAPARKGWRIRRKAGWAEFIVDIWITDFNWIEFGLYKRTRNRAKSRQFTSDMDIFAEIIEDGERTGLIGYREDLWEKAQGMDKRLVFKLFNEPQLARHHGPHDRPLAAADDRRARPAGHDLSRSTPTRTITSSISSARPTSGR